MSLHLGADMRIRLTHFDREVVSPEHAVYGGKIDNGPGYDYMRIRSRIWGSLQLAEGVKINARFVNRIHFVSSSPASENNDGAATWEYPDEVVLDKLNLELTDIAGSDWSMKLGRQDMILGNGMIFLEGTPYDQGRTIYFDGLSLRYKGEKDTLTTFAFYNNYKDKTVFINDRNRRLRQGDIFTTGAYLTHNFSRCLSTDVYYIYANLNDTDPGQFDKCERNWPWGGPPPATDADVLVHTFGGRIFGALTEKIDYSVEYAEQRGKRDHNDDLTGSMLDARLTTKLPGETCWWVPKSLLFELTRFSGDDPSSGDEMEGWIPLFAGYPIWREELLPIMFNADWTNMTQYRVQANFPFNECVHAWLAYAFIRTDYGELPNAGGGGSEWNDNIGHLVSAVVDYKVNNWLKFAFEASQFFAGNYWTDGDDSRWLRFQTVFTF